MTCLRKRGDFNVLLQQVKVYSNKSNAYFLCCTNKNNHDLLIIQQQMLMVERSDAGGKHALPGLGQGNRYWKLIINQMRVQDIIALQAFYSNFSFKYIFIVRVRDYKAMQQLLALLCFSANFQPKCRGNPACNIALLHYSQLSVFLIFSVKIILLILYTKPRK